MNKINEVPLLPSVFTDAQRISYSKKVNPKPWRVALHKPGNRKPRYVLVDANGFIIDSHRAAFLRACAAINNHEEA